MSSMDVEKTIERWTDEFTDNCKKRLIGDLSQFSTEALEWLMMEHFQFSFANCQFLWDSAQKVGSLDTDAVKKELIRNFNEERDHAAMYKGALKKVGCDVEARKKFAATEDFLNKIGKLCQRDPSSVLGTMYSTESAAVFESEVFREVSNEIIARRSHGSKGNALVAFHDLHLSGVEQSHRDELGIFLRGVQPDQDTFPGEGDRPTITPKEALEGGKAAVETMLEWWNALLVALIEKSNRQSIAV